MALTAMNVAYSVWGDLGKIDQFEEFVATGGSTTSVINGKIADRQDRPEDNYSIDYTAMIVRDAGGASAAPEGEMQRVSSYNSSTYTHTVDTAFTVAPASGDYVAIANADIPLREMYRIINRALAKFGEVPVTDTSITSAGSQTEYTLPVALKREEILRVEQQTFTGDSNNNLWEHISDFDVIPAAPGSTGTIILPQLASGRTVRLTYIGVHPTITTYSSTISEYLHPEVVITGVTKMALRWMNGTSAGGTGYWVQRENEAAQDHEDALRRHPVWIPKDTPKWFLAYGTEGYPYDVTSFNNPNNPLNR